MVQERHITFYTILGSMPQITKIHIKSLLNLQTKNFEVIALGSRDKKNDKEYKKLFDKYNVSCKIFDRDTIKVKGCYDGVYDILMNKVNPKDIFVTAHDDCIFGKNCEIFSIIREKLEEYEFCVKYENNSDMKTCCKILGKENTSTYKKIWVNGKSMHDIRIGTWFLAGNFETYKKNKLSLGDDQKVIPILYNLINNHYKVKVSPPYVYVDGGFNFNLKIHKLGLKFFVIKDKLEVRHLVHATTFFTRKGLNYKGSMSKDYWQNIPSFGKPKDWKDRWKELSKEKKFDTIKSEKKYIYYLSNAIKNLGYEIKELNLIAENCT